MSGPIHVGGIVGTWTGFAFALLWPLIRRYIGFGRLGTGAKREPTKDDLPGGVIVLTFLVLGAVIVGVFYLIPLL